VVPPDREFDRLATHVVLPELKRTLKFLGACVTGKASAEASAVGTHSSPLYLIRSVGMMATLIVIM
jgi:hypothetical protein